MSMDLNYRKKVRIFLSAENTESTSNKKELIGMKIQELQERNALVDNFTIVICGNL